MTSAADTSRQPPAKPRPILLKPIVRTFNRFEVYFGIACFMIVMFLILKLTNNITTMNASSAALMESGRLETQLTFFRQCAERGVDRKVCRALAIYATCEKYGENRNSCMTRIR